MRPCTPTSFRQISTNLMPSFRGRYSYLRQNRPCRLSAGCGCIAVCRLHCRYQPIVPPIRTLCNSSMQLWFCRRYRLNPFRTPALTASICASSSPASTAFFSIASTPQSSPAAASTVALSIFVFALHLRLRQLRVTHW